MTRGSILVSGRWLDLIIGNEGAVNQLLISEPNAPPSPPFGGFVAAVDLPGGIGATHAVGLGDHDRDGDLDVFVAKGDAPHVLLPQVHCPNVGTARSLFGSNCLVCPMPSSRRVAAHDMCIECGENEQVDFTGACGLCSPGTERRIGDPSCAACPLGKRQPRLGEGCAECEPGSYSPFNASITCFACSQGSYAASFGSSSCDTCAAGAKQAPSSPLSRHAQPHAYLLSDLCVCGPACTCERRHVQCRAWSIELQRVRHWRVLP